MSDSDEKKSGEIGLEPLLQAHIGRKLREYYDTAAREAVPDRFKLLLDRLENGEMESVGGKDSGKADQA